MVGGAAICAVRMAAPGALGLRKGRSGRRDAASACPTKPPGTGCSHSGRRSRGGLRSGDARHVTRRTEKVAARSFCLRRIADRHGTGTRRARREEREAERCPRASERPGTLVVAGGQRRLCRFGVVKRAVAPEPGRSSLLVAHRGRWAAICTTGAGRVEDARMEPRKVRSTALDPEEETAAAAFRRYAFLPLDDRHYALQPPNRG